MVDHWAWVVAAAYKPSLLVYKSQQRLVYLLRCSSLTIVIPRNLNKWQRHQTKVASNVTTRSIKSCRKRRSTNGSGSRTPATPDKLPPISQISLCRDVNYIELPLSWMVGMDPPLLKPTTINHCQSLDHHQPLLTINKAQQDLKDRLSTILNQLINWPYLTNHS